MSPIAASTGRAASKVSRGAAAMMLSVAACAPTTPPETGASTKRRPASATRGGDPLDRAGGQVAISTTMPSFGQRVEPAVGEQDLLGLRGVHDHQHQDVGAADRLVGRARRRSAGLGQGVDQGCSRTSKPRTSKPRATRFFAIGKPIEPRPMKATGHRRSAGNACSDRNAMSALCVAPSASPAGAMLALHPALDALGHGGGGDAVAVVQGRQRAGVEELVGQGDLPEGRARRRSAAAAPATASPSPPMTEWFSATTTSRPLLAGMLAGSSPRRAA